MLVIRNEKLTQIYLDVLKGILLLILFLPLFVFDQLLFPFVFPRTIVFRIVIEIGVGVYILLMLIEPRYRIRWTPISITLVALLAVLTLTAAIGPNWHHSFWSSIERSEGILTWLHLGAYFLLLAGVMRSMEDWRQVFQTTLVAGILQMIYALGQNFNLKFALITNGERLSGSIGNPIFFAAYLIFILFFGVMLFVQAKSTKLKTLYAALIALCLFLIWQTQTRGAMVGLGIGGLYMLGSILWARYKKRGLMVFFVILILMTWAGISIVKNSQAPWMQRYPMLYKLALIPRMDITTQNRLIVWGVGLQGILHKPFFGWGLENFSIPFNTYFDPAITRDIGSNPWYDRAHNMFIEIGVASGFPGLVLYLALLALPCVLLWRKKRKDIPYYEKILVTALIISYAVQNFFVFDTLNSYLMFFLVLGYVQFRTSGDLGRYPASIAIAKRPRLLPAAILVIVLLIPCIYYFNLRPALANYYAVTATVRLKEKPAMAQAYFEKAFSYSPPSEEEFRFILIQFTRDQIKLHGLTEETVPLTLFTIDEMQKTIQASPDTIQDYLLLAELYLAADKQDPGFTQKAEDITLAALLRAPRRYQVYTLLGRINVQQGDYEKAVSYFKQAVSLNDKFAEAYWNLGIAYVLSRQHELARTAFDQTQALGFNIYVPANINKLFAAYKDSRDLAATIDFLKDLHSRFPDNKDYAQALQELTDLYDQALK